MHDGARRCARVRKFAERSGTVPVSVPTSVPSGDHVLTAGRVSVTFEPGSTSRRRATRPASRDVEALGRALYEAYQDLENRPTRQALANALGVNRNIISKILNGGRLPTKVQLERLAALFDTDALPLDELRRHAIHGARQPVDAGEKSSEAVTVHYYNSTDEFYHALKLRVLSASCRVRTTYIRQLHPGRYDSQYAAEYFSSVLDWSRNGGTVSRIIGVPIHRAAPSGEYLDWLSHHADEARSFPHYDIRVIDWAGPSDALNMALIDDSSTYLTFSKMHAQERTGLSVDSPVYFQGFSDYWDQLWLGGMRVEQYLSGVSR